MLPINRDLDAYRGDFWSQEFKFVRDTTPVNLTGVTVRSEVRAPDGSRTPLQVLVPSPTLGQVFLQLPEGSLPAGSYDYDVEIDESGVVTTWVKGRLTVIRDVTNELA